MSDEVPIFTLGTVLFPQGVLPLRVFEPRYVDMIKECMRGRSVWRGPHTRWRRSRLSGVYL